MRVYRWDLDKTYLDTDFESVRGLLRSAVEPARRKRALPGATALLRELARERPGWRPRIVLLSGSPEQMRPVLEEKLRIDGIRWDDFSLKDTLASLGRGRFRAVRDQVGYKLPRLLAGRVGLGPAVKEVLFGDDAESDALIYALYADVVAGRVTPVELSRVMEAAGAYPDAIVAALAAQRRIARADAVDRIFIRLDRGAEWRDLEPLGARVVPVRAWLDAAWVLAAVGEITAEALQRVIEASPADDALVSAEGRLARGDVTAAQLRVLAAQLGPGSLADALGALPDVPPVVPPVLGPVDYLMLVRAWARRPRR